MTSRFFPGIITINIGRITSSELLKKEKYFFENNVGEYSNFDDIQKNKLLVERVESIVLAETSKYFTIHQPPQKQQEEKETPQNQNKK